MSLDMAWKSLAWTGVLPGSRSVIRRCFSTSRTPLRRGNSRWGANGLILCRRIAHTGEAMMGEPVTPGLGARIVEILERRTGVETTVGMATGETYAVFNVAWGRDMGAAWEHVTTNISPEVE